MGSQLSVNVCALVQNINNIVNLVFLQIDTYNAICLPLIDYATPVWSQRLSDT